MSMASKSPVRLSLLASAIALASVSAQAATKVELHDLNVAKLNAHYVAATRTLGAPKAANQRHAEFLGMDADYTLRQLYSKRDADGTMHYRYQQSYKGVPIFGKQVVVTEGRDGLVKNLFGRQIDGLRNDIRSTNARLSSSQALVRAKSAAFGLKAGSMVIQRQNVQKMIYVPDSKGAARLAYVVELLADAPKGNHPTRPYIIVDAMTGQVLKKWEGLTTALVGTGPGGNAKTGQYEYGTDYGFLDVEQSGGTCTMNNAEVKSVDLDGPGGDNNTAAFSYSCPRNTYKTINGAFSPINDAHYFGSVVQNMYNDYTGANALTFQLVMRVHYGTSYENAFWNGSNMTFGDGASTFYPLVSSDVAGHEVSHGYTEQHSGLIYEEQSGGMNEAYSDIAGEAVEYYWKGTNDFWVGADIFKAPGEALRYMEHPSDDGISIESALDYRNSLNPHYSSGVYNRAFYLLAHTAGWDTPKAFKVFAKANELYWTPDSSYFDGACGVEQGAVDLGYTVADVTAAFAAVDVACGGGVIDGGELLNGVPKTGQAVSGANELAYTINVPSGATNLVVSIAATTDADLYVAYDRVPSNADFDCRPYEGDGNETCTFATPDAGTWYVRVRSYAPATTGMTVTASWDGGVPPGDGGDTVGGALGNGVEVTGISKTDGSITYTLDVPAHAVYVAFTSSVGSGNADMYVKRGSTPDAGDSMCASTKTGNGERCLMVFPRAGTYYVKLKANPSFAGVSLKGEYKVF